MITDGQTNFLYLADTLAVKFPAFYTQLQNMLDACVIPYRVLPETKDVWAIDYMPIQVTNDRFVQFVYNPDYLQNDGKTNWQQTITDSRAVCHRIKVKSEQSAIVLDGGNVIRSQKAVIMTAKVFRENPGYEKRQLTRDLERLFEIETVIIIPEDPCDYTGHADGMVRFAGDNNVLVNRYGNRDDKRFRQRLRQALKEAGLMSIEVPYNPYENHSDDDANGVYINFLQMSGVIILPVFGKKEDEASVRLFEEVFSGLTIKSVDSNDIAKEGGALNCISWNVFIPDGKCNSLDC
jgi:agmatine deiminase